MATARDGGTAQIDADGIAARLAAVRERIDGAASRAGRRGDDVRLVAVSKFQPVAAIRAALAAGQADFGESRAQELAAKLETAPSAVRWHFVGRLQRNKVKQVVGRAALIHSVDRDALAEAVADQAQRRGVTQRVLVQVDIVGEARKGGCPVDALPALLERTSQLAGVSAAGLMTMPPLDVDPAPVFERLRALRARFGPEFPGLTELSMGMSADLETAVAHGATIVRVGTAIFGARPPGR